MASSRYRWPIEARSGRSFEKPCPSCSRSRFSARLASLNRPADLASRINRWCSARPCSVIVFAAFFLGEVRSYYDRIWWWDIALHTSSGLLLGLMGFLLVYILNENERADAHMRPRFVAFFAFLFAVAVGATWEIFEFSMDQLFGTNMQKSMFGDDSGLTDTMWDLIVDSVGALVITCFGWWYMHRKVRSFIEIWIRKFIDRNPGLFNQ